MHGISRPGSARVLTLYLLCSALLTTVDSAQVTRGTPTIKRVAIQGTENGIEVRITSSEPLAPQTQLLTGPDRIVVDFPGAVLAGHLGKLTVNQGGIKSVRTGQFESNPPTARVVLDLASLPEYQIVSSGTTVIVKLGSVPAGAAPASPRVAAAATGGLFKSKSKIDFRSTDDLVVTSRPVPVLPIIAAADAPVSSPPHVKTSNAVLEAQRLRDQGDLDGAVRLLRDEMTQTPGDGDAARLLAETLYWRKDTLGARAVYRKALVQHPEDTTLRLQYARMLAETGNHRQARELLTPLLKIPPARPEAEAMLGQLAYWEGDLSTARRLFLNALAEKPNLEMATRELREILDSTAPWVRVSLGGSHDDQPVDRLALAIDSGWFATPLTKLSARVQPVQFWLNGSPRSVGQFEGAISSYSPRMRLETEVAGGSVFRALNGGRWDWTGRAVMGFRLPEHFTVRARVERSPYFWTQASLNMPVMVQTATGLIHWDDPRGWLGEAGYQQQHYPDNNTIRTEYAWLLVPVVHHDGGATLQAGYAFSANDANQSRFVLAEPNQPYPPGDPRFNNAGVYAPYYTPNHQFIHSAIGAFTMRTGRGVTFHLNGSYAVRATQNAPFFAVTSGQTVLNFVPTTFSPWSVRGSFAIPVGNGLILEPTGEAGHTDFYSWAAGGFQITYHFKTSKGAAQ
jgi:hypothetical protein